VTEEVGGAASDQDGEQVVRAVQATVPSQDPVSGAMRADGRATVMFRDRP